MTNQPAAAQELDLWQVYDRHTGAPVGKPVRGLFAACRKVDRLDIQYGGYRYGKRPVIRHGVDMSTEARHV